MVSAGLFSSNNLLAIPAHDAVGDKTKLLIKTARGDIICVYRKIDFPGCRGGEHPVHAGGEQVRANATTARGNISTNKVDVARFRGAFDFAEVISQQSTFLHCKKEPVVL